MKLLPLCIKKNAFILALFIATILQSPENSQAINCNEGYAPLKDGKPDKEASHPESVTECGRDGVCLGTLDKFASLECDRTGKLFDCVENAVGKTDKTCVILFTHDFRRYRSVCNNPVDGRRRRRTPQNNQTNPDEDSYEETQFCMCKTDRCNNYDMFTGESGPPSWAVRNNRVLVLALMSTAAANI